MPLVQTRGAASAQGFGEFAQVTAANYIEDVFSTYLYTGTGAARTIVNNIDLATYGGLIWIKDRTTVTNHCLVDTVQGITKNLVSNSSAAAATVASGDDITSFTTTGWTFGLNNLNINNNGDNFVSWTFRKQPKFFDVVTWSGNDTNRTIAHNLGSVPGCIIVKATSRTSGWTVYHISTGAANYLNLNTTAASAADGGIYWNGTAPTSTVFSVGTSAGVNGSGETYVAYLFAHDAGGFGLAGTDNVISCGSGTGCTEVTLGYEPQWVMIKKTATTSAWYMVDNMRGWTAPAGVDQLLAANSSAAEFSSTNYANPTATGFIVNAHTDAFIYIAIRRGPMKVPTLGTSVFSPIARTGTGADATVTGSAGVSDAVLIKNRGSAVASLFSSRLTGTGYLVTSDTAAEVAAGTTILQANPWDVMDGVKVGTTSTITNASANTFINYLFDRAPGFFDEVCYTGTGAGTTFNHNLGAVPELIIVKRRDTTGAWDSYSSALANTEYVVLNTTAAKATGATRWNSTTPTSSVFSVGTSTTTNASAGTYVAYLFATCAGVSKVGSYTGTATTLQIDCGFTGGARFVLIKRTDSTGDWYVWDSARGIVAGNDPYLLLNSSAAEVTSTDYIDTYSAGFEISSTAPAAINASAGTYIFLAIA